MSAIWHKPFFIPAYNLKNTLPTRWQSNFQSKCVIHEIKASGFEQFSQRVFRNEPQKQTVPQSSLIN